MEDAFATLVWVVAAVGAIVALYTLVGTGRSYRQIGRGGIARDEDGPGGDGHGAPAGGATERDAEIRQLLVARNVRRARRGEAPLDVEEQLAALDRPPAADDAELREEIRRDVVARNARRVRAGAHPLDLEEEIERQLRKLT